MAAHLDKYLFVNSNEIDSIKELIKKYGSVVCTYSARMLGLNTKYISLSNTFSVDPHASIIVGWDDSIPKESFPSPASRDGAWIIQNSWGDTAHENGYYYASYDSYLKNVFAVNFSPKENANDDYNNNYFYDSQMVSKKNLVNITNEYAAIFPSLKTSYNKKEILKFQEKMLK